MLTTSSGLGLKPQHFTAALQQAPAGMWFEVHPENYLHKGGPLLSGLEKIREKASITFHSVGMSPGSVDGINKSYMQQIKQLCERFEPSLVSDHLAWTHWQQQHLNDLLPLPYTHEALKVVSRNIDQIQQILGRSIAIENPSLYFNFAQADYFEAEFLKILCQRTGCLLLIDLNNLLVNQNNVGLDPVSYLQLIPAAQVVEFHLAGHKREHIKDTVICIDNHGSQVSDELWQLYEHAIQIIGPRPTLIEWDTNVPNFDTLLTEAEKANGLLRTESKALRYG